MHRSTDQRLTPMVLDAEKIVGRRYNGHKKEMKLED
jgi:hypothetical protein